MEKQHNSHVVVSTNSLDDPAPIDIPMIPDINETEKDAISESIPVMVVKKVVNFFFDFLETTVVALSIFVVFYLFLIQPHEIKGSSMEPSFHNSEYILTDKISYRFRDPERGDVIIFKAPTNQDVDYIKRIIGLPGDRVKIQAGVIYINGKKLKESYISDSTNLLPGNFLQEGIEIAVPERKLFVMGDNRQHSSDSREFGPIPMQSIIGRAFMRYWPITEFGLLPQVSYADFKTSASGK